VIAIRITCWLAVTALGAVSLNWAAQSGSTPGEPAPQKAARQAPGNTAPQDAQTGLRKVLESAAGQIGFCMGCHKILGSPNKDPVAQGSGPHEHVVLEHGENNRCFNCHHPSSDNYGSFVRHDGSVILIDSVEQLCGKCHGPHYRAWKRGAHGQRTGYWDVEKGRQTTARCNLCHDPHQPYLKPIPTLPGPRSRRGEPLPDHPCRKEH